MFFKSFFHALSLNFISWGFPHKTIYNEIDKYSLLKHDLTMTGFLRCGVQPPSNLWQCYQSNNLIFISFIANEFEITCFVSKISSIESCFIAMTSSESFSRAKKFFWSLLLIGIFFIILIEYFEAKSLKDKFNIFDTKPFNVHQGIKNVFSKEHRSCKNNLRPPSNYRLDHEYFHKLDTSNGTFRMLSAFYDARKFFVDRKRPEIKIIVMIDIVEPTIKTYCQLWYHGLEEPVISEVHEYRYMFLKSWGFTENGPNQYRISCVNPLASIGKIPMSVSIVEQPCDVATNNLEISFNLPKNDRKKPFAICTKPYYFEDDISMIMIEWVETWIILGIDKIYINAIKVHPELMQALKFYEEEGKVVLRMFPPPLEMRTLHKNEMVALNDCFLRHMHEYEFIIAVDVDKIIVPSTWKDRNLVDFLGRKIREINLEKNVREDLVFDAYAAPNTFFFLDNNHKDEIQPEVPDKFLFLQKVYRSVNFPGVGPKSFQSTETTDVVHNHYPLFCLRDKGDLCAIPTFDHADAKLHHYRHTCSLIASMLTVEMCNDFTTNTTRDTALWNYKDEIIMKVYKSLAKLKAYKIDTKLMKVKT